MSHKPVIHVWQMGHLQNSKGKFIYIYIHLCLLLCMYDCMYVCIYIYIYIYIYSSFFQVILWYRQLHQIMWKKYVWIKLNYEFWILWNNKYITLSWNFVVCLLISCILYFPYIIRITPTIQPITKKRYPTKCQNSHKKSG